MKAFFTALLLLAGSCALAQFKLTGKITGKARPDSVYLNIPLIYGYDESNTTAIPVNANGSFSKTIDIDRQRFATITINRKPFAVMLTPRRTLTMMARLADTTSLTFAGTAAAENRLLYTLALEDGPFFMTDTTYAHLTLPQVQQKVVDKWFAARDAKVRIIERSRLSDHDKALISQEVKSDAITQLNDFARSVLTADRKQVFELVLRIYNDMRLKADVMPAGPRYYAFANSYISYLETLALKDLPDSAMKNPKTFVKYYNVTIDSGNRIAKQKGKAFLSWMLVHDQFDKDIAGNWLAQAAMTKLQTRDLAQARPLLAELEMYFPRCAYLPLLRAKAAMLESLLAANAANKDIVIAQGYENMTSIYDIVRSLKGKVVYLDIWGTWCGPCKHQIKYNPELKHHFEGKDVAFVYLDMDDDEKDGQWREFIKVNGMTGIHLRKNKDAIQTFWKELMPGKVTQYYPTYFIFDKSGRLVQTDAKQPSSRSEVYKQIEQYLDDDTGSSN